LSHYSGDVDSCDGGWRNPALPDIALPRNELLHHLSRDKCPNTSQSLRWAAYLLEALADSIDLAAADAIPPPRFQFEQPQATAAESPSTQIPTVVLSSVEEHEFQANGFSSRLPIHIPGMTKKRRNLVLVAGSGVWLPDALFRSLLFLVVLLHETYDGYVSRKSLETQSDAVQEGSAEAQFFPLAVDQALHRLRASFEPLLDILEVNPKDFVECDGRGNIRLSTHRRYVTSNRAALLQHPNEIIRRLALRLPERQTGA
jgi:hypothetical protein